MLARMRRSFCYFNDYATYIFAIHNIIHNTIHTYIPLAMNFKNLKKISISYITIEEGKKLFISKLDSTFFSLKHPRIYHPPCRYIFGLKKLRKVDNFKCFLISTFFFNSLTESIHMNFRNCSTIVPVVSYIYLLWYLLYHYWYIARKELTIVFFSIRICIEYCT